MAKIIFRPRPMLNRKIIRCAPLGQAEIKPGALRASMQLIMLRITQSFRLMVGVQDYDNYLAHMRRHHPATSPMSEKEFHRYCLEARFPSRGGKLGKCPC